MSPTLFAPLHALILLCALFLSGCAASSGATAAPKAGSLPPPATSYRREALAILAGLSLEEKCGQVLLIGVPGMKSPSADTEALITSLGPGGVILFGFNIGEKAEDLGLFTGGLQDAAALSGAALPLIVAVDHEGGGVFRFQAGVTRLPSPALVGARGEAYAHVLGERAGAELSALGVNLALAPVVELRDARNEGFLGGRSYGADPLRVDAAAGAFIRGLEEAGVAATAKHFPGNAGADPHHGLPILDIPRASLEKDYVTRFRSAIDHGVAVVLLSHVLVPSVDPEKPATTSKRIADGILKKELRFDGVALTDDLFMRAMTDEEPPRRSGIEALRAGADLLMLSDGHAGPGVARAIAAAVRAGELPLARLDDAVLRLLELKLRFAMARGFDHEGRAGRLASLPALVAASRAAIAAAGQH